VSVTERVETSRTQEHAGKRFRMIITDGVFSMDGDLAK